MRSTRTRPSAAARYNTTLLSNVHVVDPRGKGNILRQSSIQIAGDRIQCVGTQAASSQTVVVDLQGAFALPGFIADSCLSERLSCDLLFPLYLASGVTTAVLPLPPNAVRLPVSPDIQAWSHRVSRGELAGPALSVAGGATPAPYGVHPRPTHVSPFQRDRSSALSHGRTLLPAEIAQALEPLIGTIDLRPKMPLPLESRYAQLAREMTALALAAGVDLGERALDCTVVHGRLQRLQRRGLSAAEAISTFTHEAALQHGLEAGLIQEDLMADLVILSANPLEDVENAARILAVVQAGRIYGAHPVEAMWTQARNHAHRLRLSCNYFRRTQPDTFTPNAPRPSAAPAPNKKHRVTGKKISIRKKISNRVSLATDLPYLRG